MIAIMCQCVTSIQTHDTIKNWHNKYSDAPAALPLLALAVADKAEVAPIAALAEGLGADEVGVGQRAVVDDVGMAEHRAEAFQHAALLKDMAVEAFGALKVELVARVGVEVPHVAPAQATRKALNDAARTSTYYASAPFIGAALSFLLLGEPLTPLFLIATAVMAAGCWLAAKSN